MKELIKKFGYAELEKTCKKQWWRIPTREEFLNSGFKTEYKYIWVSDKHENENLGYQLNTKTGNLVEVNKRFMEHCIVIKDNK